MIRNKLGQFTSEGSKGNQFAKGNPPNKTSFDGSQFGSKHPGWKGGIQRNKRDGTYVWIGKNKRKPRARAIWEEAHGEIPDSYVIYHLDGNKDNDDLKNLKAVSRAELIKLNNKK